VGWRPWRRSPSDGAGPSTNGRSTDDGATDDRATDGSAADGSTSHVNSRVMKGGRSALRRGWALLPRCLPYLRPYRKQAAISVLVTAALAGLALAEPWPLAFVIDSVLGDRPAPGWITAIVGDGSGALILFAVVGSLLITLLSGGLTVVNEYLTTTVDQRMVLDFRGDMFQHAQRLSLAYHDDTSTGILMYRLNNQAGSLGNIVVALPLLAQNVLTIAGMAYITYRIDTGLALLALGVVPLVYYSTTFYANRIEPQLFRVRGMEAMNLSIVHEAMSMLRVVVAFGREKHEYHRFRTQGERTVDARVKLTVRQTMFKLAVSFLTAVGTAAVLGVGAQQVLAGRMTAGELLVIVSYIAAVYAPLESLSNMMATFQQDFIALEHALDLVDTPVEVTDRPGARAMDRARGHLEFEGVGFSYTTRPDTLQDITFSIRAGDAIAVVGPTGAGKSTLVSLIPRLHDPHLGQIRIDGTDIRDIKLDSLRSQFSIVLQEPLLFSGTIAQNIGYGRPGATAEEMVEAARNANAHDFIEHLPDGYQTRLGERGTKISGGERQRIAVARAFLRDSPILILDEPTSSIDSRTEGVILDALERLMAGRTTIMIAHRLSTVRSVDQILVMNEGRIVQRGSHDELIETDGLYRQLWEAQIRQRRHARSVRREPPRTDDSARDLGTISWRAPDAGRERPARPELDRIRQIDHILVVVDGRIVQHGTHDELIHRDGAYQQMWMARLKEGRPATSGNGDQRGRWAAATDGTNGGHVATAEVPRRLIQSIRDDDEVLVLADGEVAERGRHDELLRQGGLYRELRERHAGHQPITEESS
jgi:ABC-type multidrug transport system fused ATPase/permease subunit